MSLWNVHCDFSGNGSSLVIKLVHVLLFILYTCFVQLTGHLGYEELCYHGGRYEILASTTVPKYQSSIHPSKGKCGWQVELNPSSHVIMTIFYLRNEHILAG